MTHADALALLRAAVPRADGETWADLGAGGGVFTRALASLVGAGGHVHALDSDPAAVARLRASIVQRVDSAAIDVWQADLARPFDLPLLDGALMANVLHFVADAGDVLSRVVASLRPGGHVVVVEYEGRRPSRWVPHPLSAERLASLGPAAGLGPVRVAARRPSAFGGEMYVATAARIA